MLTYVLMYDRHNGAYHDVEHILRETSPRTLCGIPVYDEDLREDDPSKDLCRNCDQFIAKPPEPPENKVQALKDDRRRLLDAIRDHKRAQEEADHLDEPERGLRRGDADLALWRLLEDET